MKEYQLGLEYVDATRAYCVESGDETTAKTLVRLACTMARAEVNTGVELSERYFHAYVTEGTVLNTFHEASWVAIASWVEATDCVDLLGMSTVDAWHAVMEIPGLGTAKAAMALALMGHTQLGCIDRHMLAGHLGIPATVADAAGRTVANPTLTKAYSKLGRPNNYLATHDAIFAGCDNPRDAQWARFWDLGDAATKGTPGADFRRSSHMPYFAVVVDLVEGF